MGQLAWQNQNKTQQKPKPYGLKQSYDKQCMTLSPFLAKGSLQKPVMACGKVLVPVRISEKKKNLKAMYSLIHDKSSLVQKS